MTNDRLDGSGVDIKAVADEIQIRVEFALRQEGMEQAIRDGGIAAIAAFVLRKATAEAEEATNGSGTMCSKCKEIYGLCKNPAFGPEETIGRIFGLVASIFEPAQAEQPRLSHNHSAGSDYCPACTAPVAASPAEGPRQSWRQIISAQLEEEIARKIAEELHSTRELTLKPSTVERIAAILRRYFPQVSAGPQWISVKERLPEHGLVVLGSWVHNKYRETVMCYHWDGTDDERLCPKGWHYERTEPKWNHGKITHWQALPSPPETPRTPSSAPCEICKAPEDHAVHVVANGHGYKPAGLAGEATDGPKRCVSEFGEIRCEMSPDHKYDHWGYLPSGGTIQWVQHPARPAAPAAPEGAAPPDIATTPVKLLEAYQRATAEVRELRAKLDSLPADWQKDSSLETWFPLTAEELKRTKIERNAAQTEYLLEQNARVAAEAKLTKAREALRNIVDSAVTDADMCAICGNDVNQCSPGCAVEIARAALSGTAQSSPGVATTAGEESPAK